MNINQRNNINLEQTLLKGYDLEMVQNLSLLEGLSFAQYVEQYCSENPSLKIKGGLKSMDFDFSNIIKEETLYSHLAFQIETSFEEGEKQEALEIAASLDKNGFYSGKESLVLKKVQTLDPSGIAAKNVRETLLLQLENQGMKGSFAYRIIESFYKLFLFGDLLKLAKGLKTSKAEIKNSIDTIKKLNPYPGRSFALVNYHIIKAEMLLEYNDKWSLTFVKDFYPTIELIKKGNQKQIMDAKRFIYQLNQRKKRLEWIVSKIVKVQGDYLLGKGELKPLYREEVEKNLNISKSTLSRLLSEKYINTPIGVLPLSHFFSRKGIDSSKDISIEKAKKILCEIIENENKKAPHADAALCKLLLTRGINCSRRSVAKYRKALCIAGAYHRTLK
jgi:RNA polymerase sigma-54 factor